MGVQEIIPACFPEFPAMEPHVEVRRRQNAPFDPPFQTDYRPTPSDVKPAKICTDGDRPVDLYQVGTFGSRISSIRSRTVWPTQSNFIAKGAPRYYRARLFNGGTHRAIAYLEEWAQSPLPIETFLHIHGRHGVPDVPSFIRNTRSSSM